MEFQVLDVDYVIVNDKPVLRVFGKDAKGESVCGFREGFLPYFYAVGDDIEGIISSNILRLTSLEGSSDLLPRSELPENSRYEKDM